MLGKGSFKCYYHQVGELQINFVLYTYGSMIMFFSLLCAYVLKYF